MQSIILIGYMCVGKTTVGRPLAKELGRRFYDLDWYIENRYCQRIPQIFAEKGEAYFRQIEQQMLHEAAEFEDIVLACGGGTPCFFDNMDYMNRVATTVYLKATPETICQHLSVSRGNRPLLKDKTPAELYDFVQTQMAERSVFYERAQHVVEVDLLDNFSQIGAAVELIRHSLAL